MVQVTCPRYSSSVQIYVLFGNRLSSSARNIKETPSSIKSTNNPKELLLLHQTQAVPDTFLFGF